MLKNRFLTIFICIFVSVVLVFGATLGIIAGVRSSKAVVAYSGVRISEGALRYLSSYYKLTYIRALSSMGVKVSDTEKFWNSDSGDGVTYAELYNESFEGYVRSVAASASIFLSESSYTKEDRKSVEATIEEILKYKANGSVKEFEQIAEKYGFDYDDFCEAAELLYKADRAKYITYGESGENLVYFPDECAKYLETYSHVSLLFIRDKEMFVLDEEGNIVYENGSALLRDMTDAEKSERQSYIDKLDAAIAARENGEDNQITPEMFEIYLEKSDGDGDMHKKGYYFSENAETTVEFAEEFPEIVETSLKMKVGEYEKVQCSIGVCYIYKYAVTDGAYSDDENPFFSDFYRDASDYLYSDILATIAPEVRVKEKFSLVDYSEVPSLLEFVIAQWK